MLGDRSKQKVGSRNSIVPLNAIQFRSLPWLPNLNLCSPIRQHELFLQRNFAWRISVSQVRLPSDLIRALEWRWRHRADSNRSVLVEEYSQECKHRIGSPPNTIATSRSYNCGVSSGCLVELGQVLDVEGLTWCRVHVPYLECSGGHRGTACVVEEEDSRRVVDCFCWVHARCGACPASLSKALHNRVVNLKFVRQGNVSEHVQCIRAE